MWPIRRSVNVALVSLLPFNGYALTLLEAVQIGLNNNVSLIASRKGVEENAYNIDVSRSKFLPIISANATSTWSGNRTVLSGADDTTNSYNDHGYSVSLSQSLFNLADIYKYGTAKLDFNIEEIKNEAKTQEIIQEIAIQYFEFLKNGAQTRATKAELDSSLARLKQMQRNVELGNVAASELYEVVAQKEGIANRLRTLGKDKDVILNTLELLTQYPVIPTQDLQRSLLLAEITLDKRNDLLTQAMQYNNDIIVSEKTLERSFRTLKETGSNFAPSVAANASYRHDDTNNFDPITTPGATGISDSKSLGLTLTVPITTGGSDYYAYKKNEKTIERNELLLLDTRNTVKNDLETSVLNINDFSQSIFTFENIIRANYSSYNGIKRAYELGTRTLTDLLAAESKLFNAIRDYESAKYDYVIESIRLDKTVGNLSPLSIEKIMDLMVNASTIRESDVIPEHLKN
ncbi:TolC family protein [Vibrio sp. SCSIO 43140]|uniref:TolC family protein n=1 Tax=Vibrio sp. SCSIO 43140 TaxID=2819100 RepID=UPI002075BF3A|nr:TolC family protein [Vibrio sp. SCSIO 43140]USD61909.1 TolC family protein [Vibrio sp. SCSIO 43140]